MKYYCIDFVFFKYSYFSTYHKGSLTNWDWSTEAHFLQNKKNALILFGQKIHPSDRPTQFWENVDLSSFLPGWSTSQSLQSPYHFYPPFSSLLGSCPRDTSGPPLGGLGSRVDPLHGGWQTFLGMPTLMGSVHTFPGCF